ncbi:TIGR00725 family protein [Methanospirillum hungatei]|uniref:TIGR00725 family protein n=1 Tax=Methanospirillum hungatei TaxID=2203 RepID=UPI0026E93464|nr:TIGR00725 family protein [Methanospirillum hungatei]MCA1915270.1 TIGR00725 family protein [Methanospirillum hungatei]
MVMKMGDGIRNPGRQVAVIGGSEAEKEALLHAERVGLLLAQHGAVLLSGGRGGVMEASCRGAFHAGGIVVGIVPGSEGNSYLTVIIKTRMDHARNFILVGSADAVIAIGGEYGTLTEIAYALKSGIPVYGISTWDIPGVIPCESPDQAVLRAISDP